MGIGLDPTYIDLQGMKVWKRTWYPLSVDFPQSELLFWGGPHNQDCSGLGSRLGSPYSGKLPDRDYHADPISRSPLIARK